jgi:hypothetical protein
MRVVRRCDDMEEISMRAVNSFFILCVLLLLAACAKDRVLFVTKTSLSVVDADSKPPGVSVAYDRVEGYLGPSFEDGHVPPVIASIKSDGAVFNTKVKQLYATGDAAETVITGEPPKKCRPPVVREGRILFFGTATTAGLKVGFATDQPVPDSFVLGYRRKEVSVIPLGIVPDLDDNCKPTEKSKGSTGVYYPSVAAAINTTGEAGQDAQGQTKKVALSNQQYFATGNAAVLLSREPWFREEFMRSGAETLGAYFKSESQQQELAGVLLTCYAGVKVGDRPTVWEEADKFGLFHKEANKETLTALNGAYAEAVTADGKVEHPDVLARADGLYATTIYLPGGFDAARERLLQIHRKTVCDLSKANQP